MSDDVKLIRDALAALESAVTYADREAAFDELSPGRIARLLARLEEAERERDNLRAGIRELVAASGAPTMG